MAVVDNNDTPSSRTGITSNFALMSFEVKCQIVNVCTKLLLWSCEMLSVHAVPPIPIFGGGDIYSSQAYWESLDKYGIDGIMIGRGALIKPWILYVPYFKLPYLFLSLTSHLYRLAPRLKNAENGISAHASV